MQVLIAEDDELSRLMLQTLLIDWGYTVTIACDGKEAWEVLSSEDHPNIVILDWIMPGLDGIEIVHRLREKEQTCPHYVIIVTSKDNGNSAALALNSGADDFISKPYDIDELKARVAVGHRVTALQKTLAIQMRNLEEANTFISSLAVTDALTGLPNRRAFETNLTREINAAHRHKHQLTLVMIDLDHFKQINDTYGHDIGDHVLKKVSDLITETIRLSDMPFRWGGEEFQILLPNTSTEDAAKLAERLRIGLINCHISELTSSISASFGVAGLMMNESSSSLVHRADRALLYAKQSGRNRVEVIAES